MTSKRSPLSWELTPEEALIITGETKKDKIAKEIMSNVHVSEKNFIYLIKSKSNYLKIGIKKSHAVTYFLEAGVRPIQVSFRNRQFKHNYRRYREELQKWRNMQGTFISNVLANSIGLFVFLRNSEVLSHIVYRSCCRHSLKTGFFIGLERRHL